MCGAAGCGQAGAARGCRAAAVLPDQQAARAVRAHRAAMPRPSSPTSSRSFLRFSREVHEDLSNCHDNPAWPVVLDNFIEYQMAQRGGAHAE